MANGRPFPSALGGLREGLGTGLAIGQALQQQDLLRQQRAAQQEEEQRKADLQKFNQRMSLYDAGKNVWDENTSIEFLNTQVFPLLDGVADNLDLEGNLQGVNNVLSGAYKILQKTGDVEKFGQVLAPGLRPFKAVGGQAAEARGLEEAAAIQRLSREFPEQFQAGGGEAALETSLGRTEAGREALAARLEPVAFAPVDVAKFTPDSLRKFEQTGLRSDLELRPEELQKLAGTGSIFKRELDLRKEFASLSKPFREIRDSFARIQESAKTPSAAGDLALIFNFMKMLDPGSVVRESEFATAQNAAGVPERVRAQWNRALEGERLSDKTRNDFVSRSNQLFKRQDIQHKQREETFRRLAEKNNLNPENVVIDLNDPMVDLDARIDFLERKAAQ